MSDYEYKVLPAPTRGEKVKGAKSPEARFAHAIEAELNRVGAEGWEYLRADLLPSEERSGLTGSTTHWRTLLIFRRARAASSPAMTATMTRPAEPEPPHIASGAATMLRDNGVEEPSEVAGMTTALRARAESQSDDDRDDRTVVPLSVPAGDDTERPKDG
jgi:hypothetical protein